MKSRLAKVLHPVGGKPFIEHCVRVAQSVSAKKPVVVVSPDADQIRAALGDRVSFAVQTEQLGTGHAVMAAEAVADGGDVIVMYCDMPLILSDTLTRLREERARLGAAVVMTSLLTDNARGFGRVVRGADGDVRAVVEEVSCTPEQLAIKEVNVGLYCFDGAWLWQALRQIQRNPQKGEYFLTDLVEIAAAGKQTLSAIVCTDPDEFIGINTRVDLADAEAALRKRINRRHMLNGVTLLDPATTYIEADVEIGMDTSVLPNTHLRGATRIGEGCVIGPETTLVNALVGNHSHIQKSVVLDSRIDDHVEMGPFSRLRPGCHIHDHVHIGNFAEAKNSDVGAHTHIGHFSYMGDTTCGEHVNYSAGVITCNYDGAVKSRTVIGDFAFIGSDTLLVAPVEMGKNARTGAGAVVTKNIPANSLAVGIPARVIRHLDAEKG